MTSKDLYTAMNGLDPHLIEKAAPSKNNPEKVKKSFPVRKWLPVAACICLVFLVSVYAASRFPKEPGLHTPSTSSESAVSSTNVGDTLPSGWLVPNGNLIYLDAECKTSAAVNGTSVKHAGSESSSSVQSAPPSFGFQFGYLAVVAKAVEELPDIYQTLNAYGSIYTYRYRVFKMEVLDPLESGMAGSFYYALPEHLKGDLTRYDALLISMDQSGNDYIMLNTATKVLTAFSSMFADPYNEPELGSIIAFTDNVFDESLWQDRSWIYGYQFAEHQLDEGKGYDGMLVYRGSTLEDALSAMAHIQDGWGTWNKPVRVNQYDFQSEAAKRAIAFVKPFENGVFVPTRAMKLRYNRYVGGCPTNEWIMIDQETEEVTRSEYSFADEDFENLPDIAAYVDSLDLTTIVPQHTDTKGKKLLFNSAMGWYEKTADGVYSIVRITWRHSDENDYFMQYYDETFILLEDSGAMIVSREALISLIGDNRNIWYGEYGVGEPIPV